MRQLNLQKNIHLLTKRELISYLKELQNHQEELKEDTDVYDLMDDVKSLIKKIGIKQ